MYWIIRYGIKLIILFSIFFSGLINAQTIDEHYEIATWFDAADAAISYTFDDGCANQFTKAIPMFDEFGFCATFFIVTDWSPNWTVLQSAASNGHEIASHTVNHPFLDRIETEEEVTEFAASADIIYNHIKGLEGMTLAYPYCIRGKDSITSIYYFAARGCQGYIESSTPSDFLNISSIICGSEGSVNSVTAFQGKADTSAISNGWCIYLIHGIDDDGGYSSLSSNVLRESLQYLKQNKSKFWVAPFGDVVRYIQERNCLSVTALEETSDTLRLTVSDTLKNDKLYNYPITVKRPLPSNWNWVSGYQNGQVIQTRIIDNDAEKIIIFNVIPDNGEIILVDTDAPVKD